MVSVTDGSDRAFSLTFCEQPAQKLAKQTPSIIETKSSEFDETVEDRIKSSSPPIPDESDTPPPPSGETQGAETPVDGESDHGSAAYDPETGEINWDCPCLGGMAHGPCGEEFRVAFSCFVYSEQEPKGIDCVEKFKGMQDCFRAHPEAYGERTSRSVTKPSISLTYRLRF